VKPGGGRIERCLQAHVTGLSTGCKTAVSGIDTGPPGDPPASLCKPPPSTGVSFVAMPARTPRLEGCCGPFTDAIASMAWCTGLGR
jgi:hypothetical protein